MRDLSRPVLSILHPSLPLGSFLRVFRTLFLSFEPSLLFCLDRSSLGPVTGGGGGDEDGGGGGYDHLNFSRPSTELRPEYDSTLTLKSAG